MSETLTPQLEEIAERMAENAPEQNFIAGLSVSECEALRRRVAHLRKERAR